ncbi:UNKNOWN [Stylonychia lemnae]|uniref:Uncharacterized protein n=1 Tax=Stylonychia lemnae TaxID=5949 RepID=A0A078ABJ2_STYLE|nr:UNKNOWN [Stylonychia lemnae]|eukprot:CDW78947.1 UNKNOWN [Stylonychia lemnae]
MSRYRNTQELNLAVKLNESRKEQARRVVKLSRGFIVTSSGSPNSSQTLQDYDYLPHLKLKNESKVLNQECSRISTPKLLESLPEISNISGFSIDIDQQSSENSQSNEPRIIPQEPNKITNFKIQKQIITSNIGISYSECNRRL